MYNVQCYIQYIQSAQCYKTFNTELQLTLVFVGSLLRRRMCIKVCGNRARCTGGQLGGSHNL